MTGHFPGLRPLRAGDDAEEDEERDRQRVAQHEKGQRICVDRSVFRHDPAGGPEQNEDGGSQTGEHGEPIGMTAAGGKHEPPSLKRAWPP